MRIITAEFDPKAFYVYFGAGGNRRIIKTDGTLMDFTLVNPDGSYKWVRGLSIMRRDLDLPYGITWDLGPWHYAGTNEDWAETANLQHILMMNNIDSLDPVKTLASGVGVPLDFK